MTTPSEKLLESSAIRERYRRQTEVAIRKKWASSDLHMAQIARWTGIAYGLVRDLLKFGDSEGLSDKQLVEIHDCINR